MHFQVQINQLALQKNSNLFDKLFNSALGKLEETFTALHYEVYFDKIANHFDDKWKETMKVSIWNGVTNLDIHYISRQGMYLISIEEISQWQTIDKAFLFDMNKAVESIKTKPIRDEPSSSKQSDRKIKEERKNKQEESEPHSESKEREDKSRSKTPTRELEDEDGKVKQDFYSNDKTPTKKKKNSKDGACIQFII